MAQKNNKNGKRTPAYSSDSMAARLIFGLLFIALGVMIFLSTALRMSGDVFEGLRTFSQGMCGVIAYVLPAIPIWGGVLFIISIQRKPAMRPFLLACLMLVLICTAVTLTTFVGTQSMMDYFKSVIAQMGAADAMPAYLTRAFDFGARRASGGGLIGMLLSWPLWKGVGAIFGAVIIILGAVVNFLFLIKLDVKGIWGKMQSRQADRRAQQAALQEQQRQQELAWQQEQMRIREEQRRMQEQMRQQAIQQQGPQGYPQNYPQNYYPQQNGYPDQGVPLVRQVQPRGQQQPVQKHRNPSRRETLRDSRDSRGDGESYRYGQLLPYPLRYSRPQLR